MASLPPTQPQTPFTKTWVTIFRDLDQWDDSDRFASAHTRDLATVRGFRRLCSPKIGHLVALREGGVRIVHNIHVDAQDDLDTEGGDLWALMGAGSTAATVTIERTGAYASQTGAAIEWTTMTHWTHPPDLIPVPAAATARRPTGKAKRDDASATSNRSSTRLTRGKKTTKADYRRILELSDEDDDDDEEGHDDESDGVEEVLVQTPAKIPNLLPLPGFLVAALMEAYSTDATTLCLTAIAAINARAGQAGEDPSSSLLASRASYVAAWLWNLATKRTRAQGLGAVAGAKVEPAMNPRADAWARDIHAKYLTAQQNARSSPSLGTEGATTGLVGADVWTNLANALALQATDRAVVSSAVARKGFDAFPVTTQQMILFASERDEDAAARSKPVDTYVEILGLANAAYVAQHLHHHLRSRLRLDVHLPAGFCSAVRMAAFIASASDRPDAFSLFACAPQPLSSKSASEESDPQDDLMRMQLKIADSTTGLSDKDVKKLTIVKHSVPKSFGDLAHMCENMAGVTELVFGLRSPVTTMLRSWVRFLSNSGGMTIAGLRQLAHADPSSPARLGWFIDRRLQQYLTTCASVVHIDDVSVDLFDFVATRQQLEDGMFLFPLCNYLQAKLHPKHAPIGQSATTPLAVRGGQPDDVVTNPHGRLTRLTRQDDWQVFLDRAADAPIPNMCCRYHLNGKCVRSCHYSESHVPLTPEQKTAGLAWIASCRSRMRKPDSDGNAAKKPKVVGPRDSYLVADPSPPLHLTVARTPVAPVARKTPALDSSPSATSPAARLHASRYSEHACMPESATTAPPTIAPRLLAVRHADHATTAMPPAVTVTAPSASPIPAQPQRPPPAAHLPGKSPVSPPRSVVPIPRLHALRDPLPILPRGRLPSLLQAILVDAGPPTHPSDFHFQWTPLAAAHNAAILRQFDYDIGRALRALPFSTLTPGSEFRAPHLLAPLLSRHPLWPRFLERITLGAEFPLTPISDADRLLDVAAALARGNHKSAQGHEAKLIDMLKDEVAYGWQLPLPREVATKIPDCEVAPLGMVVQSTINEDGSRAVKLRLTHDQSFNSTKGAKRSVNDRVDPTRLTPARFGRALLRLLHFVCYLRWRFPNERLLLTKVDCKSAYRRIHLQPVTAAKSCTYIAGMLLMALRMTFGGAPNPSQWSDVSEVVADLANDLVRRDDWDPTDICAPQQPLLDSPKAVDNDAGFVRKEDAFAPAYEMSVRYPTNDCSPRFECYLDDLFGVCRESDVAKAAAVIPLALHLVSRPVSKDTEESFPRDDFLAVSKFLAEARPSERKVILGWVVNTRTLVISLPADKHLTWTKELQVLKSAPGRRVNAKALETTIGRLNHAAYVIPGARHFLGRLYRACERARACGSVRLSEAQVDDITLWERFLEDAARGISLNRVVCRWPTRVVRVDACPQGIGGYCMQSGVAWRFRLGPDLVGRATLNSLEFLAALVGVWVEHQVGPPWRADDVMLCQGDSSSATGWIARSSFGDEEPLHLAIARAMASYLMEHRIAHYAQWFPGKENLVADALSRDFHLDDNALSSLIANRFSSHIPQSFRIAPLPPAITTRVGELLQLLPKTQQLPTEPAPSAAAVGKDTWVSSKRLGTDTTPTSEAWIAENDSISSPVSRLQCEKGGQVPGLPSALWELALDGKRAQFVPPSTVWHRPFGLTNLGAPCTTHVDDSNPFWPLS